MTIQTLTSRQTPKPRRNLFLAALRAWWLRAAHRNQMRRLDEVLLDPHMARDLGLPPNEKPRSTLGLM